MNPEPCPASIPLRYRPKSGFLIPAAVLGLLAISRGEADDTGGTGAGAGSTEIPLGSILFVVYQPTPAIRILDTIGGRTHSVPLGPLASGYMYSWPTWSPDGRLFAFGVWPTGVAGQASVYVCAPDGTGLRPITAAPGNYGNPGWSPRGDRILYQEVYGGVYSLTLDDSTPQLLVEALVTHARWSPDGRRIIGSNWPDFEYQSDLFVHDLADGSVVQITHHEPDFSFNYGCYSPDATRLAAAGLDPILGQWKVVVMNADGSDQKFLTSDWLMSNEGAPTWTPDGRFLLFSSDYGGQPDVWAMRPDGTQRVRLTNTPEQEVAPFEMQPRVPLLFTSFPRLDPGGLQVELTLQGTPHSRARLETSTNLQHWQPLLTSSIPASSSAEVVTPRSASNGARFFRAVEAGR